MELSDKQWAAIERLFPSAERRRTGPKGGRPWRDPRDIVNAIIWMLRTGAPWADLPLRYPPYQTCHRRFQKWSSDGTLAAILRNLAEDLRDRGKLDLTEAYIDGSHAGAKKRDLWLGELGGVGLPRSWPYVTAMVFRSPFGLKVVKDMKRNSSKTR